VQPYLKEYLSNPVTLDDVAEAEDFLGRHGEPFNKRGWIDMINEYGGYYPVRIRAVKEGTVVPTYNALVSVENTDDRFAWATSYIEPPLLRSVWYMTTVATVSWSIKQLIMQYLEETGDPSTIDFKLHDFGARGVSSLESSALGGAAHLINFKGSDNIAGILAARDYYHEPMAGFSIPAAEHSSITSWGRDREVDAYRNMLTQFAKPGALLAVVSDSYDIFNACDMWGTVLKQQLLDSGAVVVVRPDSGDPASIVLDVVKRLDKWFGSVVNAKGYRVLNNIRVIQGDGINEDSIRAILQNLKGAGYSADNVAFGMGGALLQHVNRDTQKFAMKTSTVRINGVWVDVFKDPITDSGKRSKKGRLALIKDGSTGEFKTVPNPNDNDSFLEIVWENGELKRDQLFTELRALSNM
jgi:nicotinamide phosphoribosyltransferase